MAVDYLVATTLPADSLMHYPHISIARQLSKQVFILRSTVPPALVLPPTTLLYQQPANADWKLSPALLNTAGHTITGKTQLYHLSVSDTTAFLQWIRQHSRQARLKGSWPGGLYRVETTDSFFHYRLLPLAYVSFADQGNRRPHTESMVQDYNNSFNNINTAHALYPGLQGRGLVVSVRENLFDTTDIDFAHRILPLSIGSVFTSPHATTMATLIAGAGNSWYSGQGVATGSTLSSADFSVLLPDTGAYQRYSITVQNHSYGVGIENYYGSDAAAFDYSMLADSALLHVFSAGNSGNLSSVDGRYKNLAGWANITGSFKMAKNILVAGSIDSFYTVPVLSSRGPAYDGRIVPQLVAYGQDGSSGAAALTSGAALLLQEQYRLLHGSLPPNVLVKAVLLNSATDLLQQGPDFISGYGSLNVSRAIESMQQNRFIRSAVTQQQTSSIPLQIPAGAVNLKITLAWNDPPAAANAFTALVNDLDLALVHSASGQRWLPWVLNSSPHTDSLLLPAVRQRDSLNNVEQITIPSPPAGSYTLDVKGYRVTNGSQPFCIAYQWDTLNSFHWTSPMRKEAFIAGASNIFKWNNQYPLQQGRLEISYTGGQTWQTIDTAVALTAPYYRWQAPDTCTTAIARLQVGEAFFTTDTFTIANQAYPSVGFNCSDSLLLRWPFTRGAAGYRVLQLKNQYLQPVSEVITDSFLLLQHPDPQQPYYAVAPVTPEGLQGAPSYAVNIFNQGVSCFFRNFLADLQGDKTALLTLELGTLYSLQTIRFEKQTANGWQILQSLSVNGSTVYTLQDSALTNGLNVYRATVVTQSGQRIYSDASAVYYWQNGDYVFFPNPVPRGQTLQVLARDPFNKTLLLFNQLGQQVLQYPLLNTLEQVPLKNLPAGNYVIVILNNRKKVAQSKLLVL